MPWAISRRSSPAALCKLYTGDRTSTLPPVLATVLIRATEYNLLSHG